jgi:cyanophycinase
MGRVKLEFVLRLKRRQSEASKSKGPTSGSLLLIGGGPIGPEIASAAARLSGGERARWVVIPTAAERSDLETENVPAAMLNHRFTVLHTRDRAEADRETFVAPLKDATALWFSGGRQWRLVDVYAGTKTEREIRALLDRGGLIAGTSAGATIQGSYLVRGAPEGNLIMMSPGHEQGFGYISNAAIDQHVDARERECDLAQVVAAHPELLGIGIDEGTAVEVKRNVMTVIGIGRVLITDGAVHEGLPYYSLVAGDRFDLARWTKL